MQVLFRDVQKRVEIGSPREGVIHFDRLSEAVLYLRRHRHRTSVIATLRQVLFEHQHILVSRMTDDEIINEVSRRLLNGSLQLLEMFEPRIEAPCTVIEEPQAEAAVEMAPPPSLPPLLPLLEALQIEGAEVLPEIMQTLEQIDVTITSIGSASVSLVPAPSKIPAIGTAMDTSSADITDTLGAL